MTAVDRFRNAEPRIQIATTLFVAAVAALALLATWYLFLRVDYAPVFTGLKPGDAATLVAELDKEKEAYRLADHGATILVPATRVEKVRLTILSKDLPLKGTVGFELFNKSDLGLTEFAQRINYQRALQGELARTIMALDEVDSARVHLSLPEGGLFENERHPPKASVMLTIKPGAQADAAAIRGIQRLIASAVNNLNENDVVVLDGRGAALSVDAPAVAPASPGNQLIGGIQQYYAARVRAALEPIVPEARVMVLAIPAVPGATAQVAGDGSESAFTPETRRLPLRVTIELAASDTRLIDDVIERAKAAIGFDEAIGDSVTTRTLAEPAATPLPAPATSRTAGHAMTMAANDRLWWWIGGGTLAALLIGLIVWRSLPRRRSALDHESFAARLERLLEADEAHANAR